MDTSKEYIEMCEKAQEIQTKYFEGYNPGDYYYVPSRDDEGIQMIKHGNKNIIGVKVRYTIIYNIWLPRQDQLQELIFKNDLSKKKYLQFFRACTNILERIGDDVVESLEQVVLLVLMEFLYKKKWNKTDKLWEPLQ